MRSIYISLFSLLAVPALAFALTIEPGSLYTDVRVSNPELPGINLLTREGVVQGYSNGFFGLTRQINRAEFLKMAIVALGRHPEENMRPELDVPKVGEITDPYCFPDVRIGDWFSPSVCYAFAKEVVRGNPDGLFHPERTVNYAEALKMLTLLFQYNIPSIESVDWAEPYYRAAVIKQVDLPITIRFDTPLTRGLSARLVAAFLAESSGQLATLRLAEAGQYLPHSSEASSSSMSSSSSSPSSVSSSSSSSSSSASLFTLPPVSHFLILGRPSDAVAAITLRSAGETARIVSAQVKIFSELTALDTLELVNAKTGQSVAVLRRRTTTDIPDYKLTYEVQIPLELQPLIAADTDIPLVLRANIRSVETNGSSDQLLQLRTFSVMMHGSTSNETRNFSVPAPFPKHQTSFGKITSVKRMGPASAPIVSGTGLLVSAFSMTGEVIPTKSLSIEHLSFSLFRTGKFIVQNWRIKRSDSNKMIPCTVSQDAPVINCPNLGSMGILEGASPLVLELRADISVPSGTTDNSLEVDLDSAGSPEINGSIEWTDGSGHFKWIEGQSPVARGTRWQ